MACANCVEFIPIKGLENLQIGDHIAFGRLSYLKTFLNQLNFPSSDCKDLRWGYLYFHHAIVTGYHYNQKKITLIEFAKEDTTMSSFYKSFSKPIIRERPMNFDDIHEHLYRVVHFNVGPNSLKPEEIVENARYLLGRAKDERYNGLFNNCEHMANLCVTKRRESLQINQMTERSISRLLSNPPKWFKYMVRCLGKQLMKILLGCEKALKHKNGSKYFPVFNFIKRYLRNWLACMFSIAMIFMAMDIFRFYSAWRNEELCRSCVERWVVKTAHRVLSMLPFGMYLFLSAVALNFTGILSIEFLNMGNHFTYKELRTLTTIKPGDILTFNHYMPRPFSFHDVVVIQNVPGFILATIQRLKNILPTMTETEVFEQVSDQSLSMLNDFFRNVSEKEDSSSQYVQMHIAPNTGVNVSPENSRTLLLKRDGREWSLTDDVQNMEDIPRVRVRYDDQRIKLEYDFSGAYEVEMVHYDLEDGLRFPDVLFEGRRVVKCERKTLIPGKEHDVYQKHYSKISAAYRNSPENTVNRAIDKIGEKKWSLFSRWSSTLANECVVVDPETYYSRGYRFSRIVHTHCIDLLYADAEYLISGVGVLDFLLSRSKLDISKFPKLLGVNF